MDATRSAHRTQIKRANGCRRCVLVLEYPFCATNATHRGKSRRRRGGWHVGRRVLPKFRRNAGYLRLNASRKTEDPFAVERGVYAPWLPIGQEGVERGVKRARIVQTPRLLAICEACSRRTRRDVPHFTISRREATKHTSDESCARPAASRACGQCRPFLQNAYQKRRRLRNTQNEWVDASCDVFKKSFGANHAISLTEAQT